MKKKKKGSGNGAVLHRMLRGSVRYFVICILSGVTFTALELVIPQILRLTVDSVIGDKAADLPVRLQRLWDAAGGAAYSASRRAFFAARELRSRSAAASRSRRSFRESALGSSGVSTVRASSASES